VVVRTSPASRADLAGRLWPERTSLRRFAAVAPCGCDLTNVNYLLIPEPRNAGHVGLPWLSLKPSLERAKRAPERHMRPVRSLLGGSTHRAVLLIVYFFCVVVSSRVLAASSRSCSATCLYQRGSLCFGAAVRAINLSVPILVCYHKGSPLSAQNERPSDTCAR
jgi:hypothetical protein